MLVGFKNAILRPGNCTSATVPSTLESMRFFFRQEWRDRAIAGRRRYNRLRHFLKSAAPRCCGGGRYDEFYGVAAEQRTPPGDRSQAKRGTKRPSVLGSIFSPGPTAANHIDIDVVSASGQRLDASLDTMPHASTPAPAE